MSAPAIALENLLARQEVAAAFDPTRLSLNDLKQAARVWYGTSANAMRKGELIKALQGLHRDRKRLEAGLQKLKDHQRAILAIFRRYGGALTGSLLTAEVRARGLVAKREDSNPYLHQPRKDDPVLDLVAKRVLLPRNAGRYHDYYHYSYYGYRHAYPTLILPPALAELVQPAAPLSWKASVPAAVPTVTFQRPPAAVALDLWTIAQGLAQMGSWKTLRDGAPAKSVQNKLHKLMPADQHDPLQPPVIIGLYYEILFGLGAIEADRDGGALDLAVVEQQLSQPAVVQAWHWVRAWMEAGYWEDGVGMVPGSSHEYDPAGLEPGGLRGLRELLVWALGRVAHGTHEWLDLETFLIDLWSIQEEETPQFYHEEYDWQPRFARAGTRDDTLVGPVKTVAPWLRSAGTWAANALLGTLAYLGLVERGSQGPTPEKHPSFRLTAVGRAVFGAPDVTAPEPAEDARFLIVQPNHEVLAYLDVADASAVGPLVQMAQRASSPGSSVQTFTLTRESVYQALEAGLKLNEIQRFLTDHSRTGLPANVAQSLVEWSRKRESLALRTDVALGVFPPGGGAPFQGAAKARPIGEQCVLLSRTAARGIPGVLHRDHNTAPPPGWQVSEDGRVTVTNSADAVALACLSQFADRGTQGWTITETSVRRARERGIPGEQVLDWLRLYLAGELPPLLEMAVRNWANPTSAFVGTVVLLQVFQQPAVAAILGSRRFWPLLHGHIPPNWFLVRAEKREELERRLVELGFLVGGSYQLVQPFQDEDKKEDARSPGRGRRPRKQSS